MPVLFDTPQRGVKLKNLSPGDIVLTKQDQLRIYIGEVTTYALVFDEKKKELRFEQTTRNIVSGKVHQILPDRDPLLTAKPLISRFSPDFLVGRTELEGKGFQSFMPRHTRWTVNLKATVSAASTLNRPPSLSWKTVKEATKKSPPGVFQSLYDFVRPKFFFIPRKNGGHYFCVQSHQTLLWGIESLDQVEEVIRTGRSLSLGRRIGIRNGYEGFKRLLEKELGNSGEMKVLLLS